MVFRSLDWSLAVRSDARCAPHIALAFMGAGFRSLGDTWADNGETVRDIGRSYSVSHSTISRLSS
jgi:hypothetical protein